jgi:hypothetical protein
MSRRRSLRRRWKLYLAMLLIVITSAAVLVIVLIDIDAPSRTQAPQSAPVPAAIR